MSHENKKGFRQLEVWKLSMRLTDKIYDLTEKFPIDQRYGLSSQMQRCAVSIPSNIAEGCAKASKKEFIQFLYIVRGSLAELETQMILSFARKYIEKEIYKEICLIIESINKMLGKLIKSQKQPSTHDA